MNLTSLALYPGGQLGVLVLALYTAPIKTNALVTAAAFINTDTVARTITVYVVRAGQSPSLANVVIDAQSVDPGTTYISPELAGRNLATGDSIQALASVAGKINAVIDGYEIAA